MMMFSGSTLIQQPAVGQHGVFQAGGEGMSRRQPVIGHQGPGIGVLHSLLTMPVWALGVRMT